MRSAVQVTLIYLVFGTLWIVGSDALLASFTHSAAGLSRLQTVKGAVFVLATGAIFCYLAYRELKRRYEGDLEANRRQRVLQSLFEATFEHAAAGMAYNSLDGRFVRVNRAYCQLTGYSRDELLTMRYQDITHDGDLARDEEQQHRMIVGELSSFSLDKRFVRKDGTAVWTNLTSSMVPAAEGGDAHTLAVITDISDRKAAEQALRASESKFRAIYEGADDALLILEARTGAVVGMNPKAEQLSGYSADETGGLSMADLSAGDPATIRLETQKRIDQAASGEPQIFEWRARDRHGRELWMEINMRAARIGDADRILVLARDISERRQSEEKLRLTNQVLMSTREGVIITDTENRILSVNPAFTEITGYTEPEVIGKTPRIMQSGFHDRLFYQSMWQSIARTKHWQGEIWNRRKSGETYPEWLTISAVHNEHGVLTNYVGVFTDVSRIKHSEAEVQRLAHYDSLTNYPNRVLLVSRLEHALELGRRHGTRIALMFCGLDRFKYINDSLGYSAGDELLQAMSRRIRSSLQRGDTLARFSGDEFAVLIESDRRPGEIAQLAQDIVALGESSIGLSTGQRVFAGLSVGISMFPADGDDATALITNANAAMQQAKIESRHTYRFYTEGMTEAARRRLQMESRLRRAVEHQEFDLHFQPLLEVATRRIIGAEALIRWHDPEAGVIPPDEFIPLAEDTGLIVPLGRWVLESACRQAVAWRLAGLDGLSIAVNLSSRQFESCNLTQEVASVIAASGLDPCSLELEITETALMEHGERSLSMLNGLREIGVRVSIDDFGTGYSSLAYLKRFAINKFKIDGMFIKDLPGDHEDAEIVSTMIGMAHNLNLQVVAEGVETSSQLEFLKMRGCDEFQGHLASPAVPAAEFEALLQRPRAAAKA